MGIERHTDRAVGFNEVGVAGAEIDTRDEDTAAVRAAIIEALRRGSNRVGRSRTKSSRRSRGEARRRGGGISDRGDVSRAWRGVG